MYTKVPLSPTPLSPPCDVWNGRVKEGINKYKEKEKKKEKKWKTNKKTEKRKMFREVV